MVSRPFLRRLAETPLKFALLLAVSWAFAASPWPAVTPDAIAADAVPVVVTAKTLTADNKKKTVVYKTGVVVKRGAVTLYADSVTIRLAPDGKKSEAKGSDSGDFFSGAGKVQTIEAGGGVKIVQDDKTAIADRAEYDVDSDVITLTGKPRVWQGPNVLTGSSITFNVAEDTITVQDARTVLYQDEGALPGGMADTAGGAQ